MCLSSLFRPLVLLLLTSRFRHTRRSHVRNWQRRCLSFFFSSSFALVFLLLLRLVSVVEKTSRAVVICLDR